MTVSVRSVSQSCDYKTVCKVTFYLIYAHFAVTHMCLT